MHGKIIPQKPPRRAMPVFVLIDDSDGTADIITINPEAFTISKRQITSKLRDLIANWMETRAA